MLTMQYAITLPADYDMNIVRERVARLGPTMDAYEHLSFKAFLITEAGKDGNHENRYAPFLSLAFRSGHAHVSEQ